MAQHPPDLVEHQCLTWVLLALLTVLDERRSARGKPPLVDRMLALLELLARSPPRVGALRAAAGDANMDFSLAHAIRFLQAARRMRKVWSPELRKVARRR